MSDGWEIGQGLLRDEERVLFEERVQIEGELRDERFLISYANGLVSGAKSAYFAAAWTARPIPRLKSAAPLSRGSLPHPVAARRLAFGSSLTARPPRTR
jgi:hypothetical protein